MKRFIEVMSAGRIKRDGETEEKSITRPELDCSDYDDPIPNSKPSLIQNHLPQNFIKIKSKHKKEIKKILVEVLK